MLAQWAVLSQDALQGPLDSRRRHRLQAAHGAVRHEVNDARDDRSSLHELPVDVTLSRLYGGRERVLLNEGEEVVHSGETIRKGYGTTVNCNSSNRPV